MSASRVSIYNPLGLKEDKLLINRYSFKRVPINNVQYLNNSLQEEQELSNSQDQLVLDPQYIMPHYLKNHAAKTSSSDQLREEHLANSYAQKNAINANPQYRPFDFILHFFNHHIEPFDDDRQNYHEFDSKINAPIEYRSDSYYLQDIESVYPDRVPDRVLDAKPKVLATEPVSPPKKPKQKTVIYVPDDDSDDKIIDSIDKLERDLTVEQNVSIRSRSSFKVIEDSIS